MLKIISTFIIAFLPLMGYPGFVVDIGELLMQFSDGLFLADIIHILLGAEVLQIAIVSEPLEEVEFAHSQCQVEVGLSCLGRLEGAASADMFL